MLENPQQPSEEIIHGLPWKHRLFYLAQVSLFAVAFYIVTQLSALLEEGQRGMIPISLSSGFSLAIILLFGIRLWPGIVVGLFAVKIPFVLILTDYELAKTLVVPFIITTFEAIGEVLKVVIAVWFLNHLEFQDTLSRVYDVLLFTIVAVIVSPLLGASFSSIGLLMTEGIPLEFVGKIWLTDWLSGGIGILVLCSTLLVWRRSPSPLYADTRTLEWSLLLVCLTVVSSLTLKAEQGNRLMLLYLILPFAVWAAIRFEQHGATLAALLITGILLNGGLNRVIEPEFLGALNYTRVHDILLELSFIAITAFTALMVAATYTEQRQITETLYDKKECFSAILRAVADAVIVVDTSERITYLNPVAQQMIGWTREQIIGKSIGEIIYLKSAVTLDNWIKQGLEGKSLTLPQQILLSHDRKEKIITLAMTPIWQRSGKIMGVTLSLIIPVDSEPL